MSVPSFIAEYLQQNNYLKTLKAFEIEHGTPISTHTGHNETLEQILCDRISYTADFEIKGLQLSDKNQAIVDQELPKWSTPYAKSQQEIPGITGLVIAAGIIEKKLILSTNDGTVKVCNTEGKLLWQKPRFLDGVVTRAIVVIDKHRILAIGMNGSAYLYGMDGDELHRKAKIDLHRGLIIDSNYAVVGNKTYAVTLGWDKWIKVMEIGEESLDEIASYQTTLPGTCIGITDAYGRATVVLGHTESTLLQVLELEHGSEQKLKPIYKISLNDAEFMTHAFTPRNIKIAATGNGPLVAVATSEQPYMRVIVLKLQSDTAKDNSVLRNQVLTNTNTGVPQDKFSQPLISWRHPATGIWVFGEDGIVRGIDVQSQREVVSIVGHKSRIKCVAVGEAIVTFASDQSVSIYT